MKCTLAIALLFSCCSVFSFVQTTAPPTEQKPAPQATSSSQKQDASLKLAVGFSPIVILTDTMGVDIGPYLQRVTREIRKNWYNLIPYQARAPLMEKGSVTIDFAILEDGTIDRMKLTSTSGVVALDRAAWRGIVESSPFPPLPSEFRYNPLGFRFPFYYNQDKGDFGPSQAGQSYVWVSISAYGQEVPIGIEVPIGGSQKLSPTVTGSTNTAVKWSVAGPGCSGSTCGTMSGDLYLAPTVQPSPPSVVLTATSQAEPNAWALVTVQLLKPD